MASGDLIFVVNLKPVELTQQQKSALATFISNGGFWDGALGDITNFSVDKVGNEYEITVNGLKSAPADEVPFPAQIVGIEP